MAKRLTQKQIITALHKRHGILMAAAKDLGCTRQTIYNRMKKDPKIAQAYEDANEIALDFSESALFVNIGQGKESSIFYHLNNKGASRGYSRLLKIAPTDPTGTKEYGSDIRDVILSKLLPSLAAGNEEGEAGEADG